MRQDVNGYSNLFLVLMVKRVIGYLLLQEVNFFPDKDQICIDKLNVFKVYIYDSLISITQF